MPFGASPVRLVKIQRKRSTYFAGGNQYLAPAIAVNIERQKPVQRTDSAEKVVIRSGD
jgi:hypothetical protein